MTTLISKIEHIKHYAKQIAELTNKLANANLTDSERNDIVYNIKAMQKVVKALEKSK